MSVKTKLLSILEANREVDVSGEELAKQLGVTRTSVWKAVRALREEGYEIEAVNNRGYRLRQSTDVVSEEGIRLELKRRCSHYPIRVYKSIDSTNTECKRLALDGAEHGLTVLAEEQTAGQGRLGRSFYSPAGTGIYMSLLIRPKLNGSDSILITTAAAVAVCRGIRQVLSVKPEIKWVNDVYLGERKICGILSEAVSDCEMGRLEYVVVGIGINYRTTDFPEELKTRAGSIGDVRNVPRNRLVGAIINEFWEIYDGLEERTFLEEYREYSNVIGKEVRFLEKGSWQDAIALDIDSDGGLIVEYEVPGKGRIQRTLHTGEITLRLKSSFV